MVHGRCKSSNLRYPEAAAWRCSVKKGVLELSQNSQENTCAKASFLIKNLYLKKRLWHRCFPVIFVKFLISPFFRELLQWLLLNEWNISIYNTALPIKSCRLIPLKVHSEPCRTSKMKLLQNIGNGYKSWTIFAKSFILDVWKGSEYMSGFPT